MFGRAKKVRRIQGRSLLVSCGRYENWQNGMLGSPKYFSPNLGNCLPSHLATYSKMMGLGPQVRWLPTVFGEESPRPVPRICILGKARLVVVRFGYVFTTMTAIMFLHFGRDEKYVFVFTVESCLDHPCGTWLSGVSPKQMLIVSAAALQHRGSISPSFYVFTQSFYASISQKRKK